MYVDRKARLHVFRPFLFFIAISAEKVFIKTGSAIAAAAEFARSQAVLAHGLAATVAGDEAVHAERTVAAIADRHAACADLGLAAGAAGPLFVAHEDAAVSAGLADPLFQRDKGTS